MKAPLGPPDQLGGERAEELSGQRVEVRGERLREVIEVKAKTMAGGAKR